MVLQPSIPCLEQPGSLLCCPPHTMEIIWLKQELFVPPACSMWGFFIGAETPNWNSSGSWGAMGSQQRAGQSWGEWMASSSRAPRWLSYRGNSFQQPPFASSSPPRVSSPHGEVFLLRRIITKTLCLTKACWFGSLLLFLFLLTAKIKSHFWPASSCSSVAQPRQSAQGKISLAGAPKSPMTTAEDNFIWKNTSELKVLHLYSLLEGWNEVNHPQGWWDQWI